MSERHETGIQWTHVPGYRGATWNPTTEFAVGTGGHFTEAARDIRLMRGNGARLPFPPQYDVPFSTVQLLDEKRLTEPRRRRIPTAYFVDSMSDLFHEDVPAEFIDRVFAVMALCPQHIFMVLTKRPKRMHDYVTKKDRDEAIGWAAAALYESHGGDYSRANLLIHPGIHGGPRVWPLPNVWLGVSVEDQERADERIPWLLDTPAAVRFLSCEPLLGPVDLTRIEVVTPEPPHVPGVWVDSLTSYVLGPDEYLDGRPTIDWVIAGGESGRHARPFDLAWARSLRDQCAVAGVPFFMKQLGARPMLPLTEDGNREWHAGLAAGLWRSDGSYRRGEDDERLGFAMRFRNAHGADPAEWPEDLRVRQWPEVAS